MLKGFWKLTWVELKIFVREPLGLAGTLAAPLLLFVLFSRLMKGDADAASATATSTTNAAAPFNVAILAALLIAINAVMSLIAIMAIYREGGILKRLRATPLSPLTILSAHVVVKLVLTVLSLMLLIGAGKRLFPGAMTVPFVSFAAAVLLGSLSILSLGFLIASMVPTSRFAQPIGAVVLYPMVALSGLFFPLRDLPTWLQVVASALPTTHAVALLQGVWDGSGWQAHASDVVALALIFAVCSALATRWFRWE
ncbi:MAG: ABC transporter permease [Gemmatimonadaceae bacterium]|jgi:ABC-2 type transport system permease protein|nr:ABC transporter permease [Gemmatimonadaceae bacterium]MCC6432998.1 ABC transporter permease [Gemmatimonadaceae bacterium]